MASTDQIPVMGCELQGSIYSDQWGVPIVFVYGVPLHNGCFSCGISSLTNLQDMAIKCMVWTRNSPLQKSVINKCEKTNSTKINSFLRNDCLLQNPDHICSCISDKEYVANDWIVRMHKGIVVGMIAMPILFCIVQCILNWNVWKEVIKFLYKQFLFFFFFF